MVIGVPGATTRRPETSAGFALTLNPSPTAWEREAKHIRDAGISPSPAARERKAGGADKGTTLGFKRLAPSSIFSTPLSVNGEGGRLALHTHGSPSPLTEKGVGGEVEQAWKITAASPQVEATRCTLVRAGGEGESVIPEAPIGKISIGGSTKTKTGGVSWIRTCSPSPPAPLPPRGRGGASARTTQACPLSRDAGEGGRG